MYLLACFPTTDVSLQSEVIPELGKRMMFLMGEIFLQPSFLQPSCFTDTKKVFRGEKFLHFFYPVFLSPCSVDSAKLGGKNCLDKKL